MQTEIIFQNEQSRQEAFDSGDDGSDDGRTPSPPYLVLGKDQKNLPRETILQLLRDPDMNKVVPAGQFKALANGGEVYVFEVNDDTQAIEKIRQDGYRWYHGGTHPVKALLKKMHVNLGYYWHGTAKSKDSRFKRHIYTLGGKSRFMIVHYLGDESVASEPDRPCRTHKNVKNKDTGREYIPNSRHIKPHVLSDGNKTEPENLIRNMKPVYADGTAEQMVELPRNVDQVHYVQKKTREQLRLFHDGFASLVELQQSVSFIREIKFSKLGQTDEVSIYCWIPNTLKLFTDMVENARTTFGNEPIVLHYDTTFEIGGYYLSTLTYRYDYYSLLRLVRYEY